MTADNTQEPQEDKTTPTRTAWITGEAVTHPYHTGRGLARENHCALVWLVDDGAFINSAFRDGITRWSRHRIYEFEWSTRVPEHLEGTPSIEARGIPLPNHHAVLEAVETNWDGNIRICVTHDARLLIARAYPTSKLLLVSTARTTRLILTDGGELATIGEDGMTGTVLDSDCESYKPDWKTVKQLDGALQRVRRVRVPEGSR